MVHTLPDLAGSFENTKNHVPEMKRSCRNVQEICLEDLFWQPQITTDKKIDDRHGSSTMMAFSGSAPPSFALRFGAGLTNTHEMVLGEDSVSMLVWNVVFFIFISHQLFLLITDHARNSRAQSFSPTPSPPPLISVPPLLSFVPCCCCAIQHSTVLLVR